jgi:DNA phosphorothioation-dependent restriction protein DptG
MSEFNLKSDLTSVLNRVNALENERKTLQEQNERLERLAQTKHEETKTQIDTMIAKWLEDITNVKKEEAIKKEIDALRNKNATLTQKDEANMLALTQSMERLRVTEAVTAECIASIQAAIAEFTCVYLVLFTCACLVFFTWWGDAHSKCPNSIPSPI